MLYANTTLARQDSQAYNTPMKWLKRLGLSALVRAFGDADRFVRENATTTLVKFGSSAVPPLIMALSDPVFRVRFLGAKVLGRMGSPTADAAVPALIAALDDMHGDVRLTAAETLGRIGSPAANVAIPALRACLTDSDDEMRVSVAEAIRQIELA